MARQAPTYAAHIAKIRQQALEETAAEQERLRGQLGRVESEMKRLQACCDADRQATKDLMEVEKIQVCTVHLLCIHSVTLYCVVCMVTFMCVNRGSGEDPGIYCVTRILLCVW